MNVHDTLTVVKLLAAGRAIPVVASVVGVPGEEVSEVGGRYGWPDKERLREAAKELTDGAGATIAAAKACTRCKAIRPLAHFRKDKSRRDGLTQYCRDCLVAAEANRARPYKENEAVRSRAKVRAARRLVESHREEYELLLAEEVVKARAELAALDAAAAAKKAASQPEHHGHRQVKTVPLLKGGPRPAGQDITDRLRQDVGRCPQCISSHDRGHTCPACGAAPDERSP